MNEHYGVVLVRLEERVASIEERLDKLERSVESLWDKESES